MNEDEFISVCKNYQLINKKFFPFPIYLVIANKFQNLCKVNTTIKLTYKKKDICEFFIKNIFTLKKHKKIELGKLLFKTKSTSHPGLKFFLNEGNLYLSGKINKINQLVFKKFNFSTPNKIKSQLKKRKNIVGFHTRNIPHKGHEWIHEYGLSKCKNILIQPIIGQFKKGEYTEEAVLKSNKFLVRSKNKIINNNFRYFFSFINLQPKYGGPREALLHALIRKNYGCTHFLVGRDHAGFKNFYKIYESQNICKKFESKLKIKIITYKSPKICIKCKVVTNQKCDCKNNLNSKFMRDINGSFIRKLIKNKKIPPSYMINKKYYQNLNIKKLIL